MRRHRRRSRSIRRSYGSFCISCDEALALARRAGSRPGTRQSLEEQLARVLAVLADLVERAARRVKPVESVGLDDEQRDALGAPAPASVLHDDDDEVRELAVGDERLRAVDDVVVAVADAPWS